MATLQFKGDMTENVTHLHEVSGKFVPHKPDTEFGIPNRSAVRIEALPTRSPVFIGRVNESAYVDLDPGRYAYAVLRLTGGTVDDRKLDDVCYRGEFLYDIELDAWNEMRHMKPTMHRTLVTSEGTRWRCLVRGCDNECTNPVSALLHEVTAHLGIKREDFLKEPRKVGRKIATQLQNLSANVLKETGTPSKKQIFQEIG